MYRILEWKRLYACLSEKVFISDLSKVLRLKVERDLFTTFRSFFNLIPFWQQVGRKIEIWCIYFIIHIHYLIVSLAENAITKGFQPIFIAGFEIWVACISTISIWTFSSFVNSNIQLFSLFLFFEIFEFNRVTNVLICRSSCHILAGTLPSEKS